MKDVLQIESHRVSTNEKNLYATPEDFEQMFANENTELLRLSLHLTADAEKAESCLVLAMRDCLNRSIVCKDQVQSWARRMVIRNAIRMVWGTPNDSVGESGFELQLQPTEFPLEQLRESVSILTLPDLDRLAFVICVLERYSILDCALLLRNTPQEVYEAIVRANSLVLAIEQGEATTILPTNMYCAFQDPANQSRGSCGSIFD